MVPTRIFLGADRDDHIALLAFKVGPSACRPPQSLEHHAVSKRDVDILLRWLSLSLTPWLESDLSMFRPLIEDGYRH